MPGNIRVGGVWKTVTPHIRVGGVWKKPRNGWVRVNGVWSQWYTALTTFSYTGSLQTYVVPTGITSIEVDLAGGAGGGGSNTVPGGGNAGNRIQAVLSVTPGQTLHIAVGGAGIGAFTCANTGSDQYGARAGGWPGGGSSGNPTWPNVPGCISTGGSGGGYSGIFTSSTLNQANALIIAGAGGGKGVGAGGNGSNGTTSAGGARGTGSGGNNDHTNGSALAGGNGESNAFASNVYPGAGGGSGYFGGGGGATVSGGSGFGGNGSSWATASATSVVQTSGFQSGNGYVTIFG